VRRSDLCCAWRRGAVDWSDETISTSSERFDEHWSVRRFAQSIAQPLDGSIESMIKIDEGVRRPEPIAQFVTGNHFPGMLQKQAKNAERLLLEFELDSILA